MPPVNVDAGVSTYTVYIAKYQSLSGRCLIS